ncbi:MAG: lytic transglycosylase domain-containing protein [Bdellovibrionota bacterium]
MKTPIQTLVAIALFSTVLFETARGSTNGPLSQAQREGRVEHAQELLGSHYSRSVVRTGEQVRKINGSVYKWTKESLPAKHKVLSSKIAQAIIDESMKHGFDPVFVMAIIQTESTFNPDQIGGVGEIGLMQIRPETGEWMAKIAGIPWAGKKTLRDPLMNIKIGCAYLTWLREKFDSHARLYLAAYNMGQNNVRELLRESRWPKDYPAKVMENYVGFYEELKVRSPAARSRS